MLRDNQMYTGYVLDTNVDFVSKHWVFKYFSMQAVVRALQDIARDIGSTKFIVEVVNKNYIQYVYKTKEFNLVNKTWEENEWVKH